MILILLSSIAFLIFSIFFNNPNNGVVLQRQTVLSYSWCIPGEIFLFDDFSEEEYNLRVLMGFHYEDLDVCHVREEFSGKTYLISEDKTRFFFLKHGKNQFCS